MKNLSIIALIIVVMLTGCASSRTFQLQQKSVADNSRSRIKHIKLQKAAEIAKQVLQENSYFIAHFEWEAGRYACVKGNEGCSSQGNEAYSGSKAFVFLGLFGL